MSKQSFTLKALRRDIGKRVDTFDGAGVKNGWTTKPDGYELGDIELVIDVDQLARVLGAKAMKNTGGRSSIAWGLVVAKVTKRQRVKP